ncbi:MAG: DNA-binding protein [Bacteroides sp.]|nr:DNA-binding protein [Bacteroides sp.]
METNQSNEIILYKPDETLALDVRVEDESVWLTQAQMAELFQTTRNNITLHTRNIFKEGELSENSVCKESLLTAGDGKRYRTKLYNLDVIISVGYRVKSVRGTQFRQWANKILKEYLLRGYSINQRLMQLEDRIDRRLSEHDRHLLQLDEKVDFFVRSSLQPIEGVFFNGQIFDAYALIADLIRQAKTRIVLIDNYIDDTVLTQLSKRKQGVTVDIYDGQISKQLRQDVEKHNEQYPGVTLHKYSKAHDRFLIIDEDVYHIGASLKDLGKKLFAFSKMEVMTGAELIAGLK